MGAPKKFLFNPTVHAPVTDDLHIATKAYVDGLAAANDAMVYMGAIDASLNPDYPAATGAGETYKISVAGRIGGASGPQVEVGDIIISTAAALTGDHATVGASWTILQTNMVQATTAATGFVELATKAEAELRTDTVRAVTPASLADFALKSEAPSLLVKTGVGSPIVNAEGPDFIGQIYVDTTNRHVYVANSLNITDWSAVNSGIGSSALWNTTNSPTYNFLTHGILNWSPTGTPFKLTVKPAADMPAGADHTFDVVYTVPASGATSHGFMVEILNHQDTPQTIIWDGGNAPEFVTTSTDDNTAYVNNDLNGKTFVFSFRWRVTSGGVNSVVASCRDVAAAPGSDVLTGSGSPLGVLVPAFSGQMYVDESSEIAWIAGWTSNQSWKPISGGGYNARIVTGISTSFYPGYAYNEHINPAGNYTATLEYEFVANDSLNISDRDMQFTFNTTANNYTLTLVSTENYPILWEGGSVCPCVAGTAAANEKYWLKFYFNPGLQGVIYASWELVGADDSAYRGLLTTTQADGYQKTVYRTVTAASSGTILGTATGIANKYVQVSAYEAGMPNVPVGIDCTIAANGDIAWTTASAFTGYIVVSGSVTPVSI